jgi:non-ribosomal peptide synthetase component F
VEAVVKERDMSRSSLFQVMFVLQNTPDVPQLRLGEVELSRQGFEYNIAKFDLTCFMSESADGLQGSVGYCTDLFTEETVVRMISHFKELLGSIAAAPGEKIGTLPMLTGAEKEQLLKEFNDSVVDYPKDRNVVQLFEEQASKIPGAIALRFEGEELSYGELNGRANELAHYLRSKGVKEETLVPICMERSLDMIVGLLGILKAGGAYVPIDTDFPAERIQFMLSGYAS